MSFDADFQATAAGDLLASLGGEVARWPAGDGDAAEAVTAVWEPDQLASGHEGMTGVRYTLSGVLTIDSTQAVARDDLWSVGGETFRVDSIGDAVAGLRPVRLKRAEKVTTSKTTDRR